MHTITSLRADFAQKKTSPAEIWQYYQQRIAAYNSQLNAFVHVNQTPPPAPAGPLAGLPIGLKDIFCSTDSPTTAGSRILTGFMAPYQATVVDRLTGAGASLIGKLNTDEFAMGASTENSAYGPTRNPYDLTRVAGGSSGGSAAAVAADLCVAATGSDTGGSIRQPASFCGCTGLKPSYGRTSRYGVISMASSLDTIGVLTKTVEDAALLLEIMAGADPHDATTLTTPPPRYTQSLTNDLAGRTIGVPQEYFSDEIDPEIRAAVRAALPVWEQAGVRIKEISLPLTRSAVAVYYIIVPAEVSSNMARFDGIRFGPSNDQSADLSEFYITNRDRFGDEVKRRILIGTYTLSAGHYEEYYGRAVAVRQLIKQEFHQAFQDVDVIVAPTTPTTAFKVGGQTSPLAMYLADLLTIPASLAGLGGLTIPCGWSSEQLPIGLQILGRPDDEVSLLNFGHYFQTHTDWHQRTPDLLAKTADLK